MFFVVTTGRSGSQTIARILSLSANCICLHEPEPVLIKEATFYQYGLLSEEYLRAVLLSTRVPTLGGKTYGESNQKLSTLIPVLAEAFPDSQFIWLVRDGRDVVASTHFARQWYTPVEELVGQRKYLSTSLKLKEWIWYRLRGDLLGAMTTEQWETLSRFEKNCWLWSQTNQIIQGHLQDLPGERWMLVRLTSLFRQLEDICRFVGIEPIPHVEGARYNVSKKRSKASAAPVHWTEWTEHKKGLFEKWCQEMMDSLYPEWRNESGTWCSIADTTLPPVKSTSWQQRVDHLRRALARRLPDVQ